MARPPLPIGAWGDIGITGVKGRYRAAARYRGKDGRTRVFSRFRPTKGAARQALLDHFTDMSTADRSGTLLPESRTSDLLDEWLARYTAAKNPPQTTRKAHARAVGIAGEHVGGLRIVEASTARLDAAVQAVAAKRGVETSRQVAGVLRQGFGLALRLGAVSVNPALGIEVKTATAEPVRAMTADEAARLRKHARDFEAMPTASTRPWRREIAAAVDVMLGTGVRIGELAGLRWGDVNLTTVPATMTVGAIVTLDEVGVSRQERTKTASSERVLYLPAFATKALREHRGKALDDSDDSPVFPNERGGWWDTSGIRRRFREVRKLAELDWVSPKTIRKTVATAVYNSDSLDNASQQLGHSEVGVTSKHYVQQSNMGPVEVVGVLDSFIQRVS